VQTWVSGILGALVVAGITALVAVYGDVGKLQSDNSSLRREVNELSRQSGVHGEAVARMEERVRCKK
jgi:TolA-binding protein